MPGKKQFYRLFKVAKELNVGTALLVEHLQENGHDVSPSPNTKLSTAQYDILLKEFASEKLMKEKATQLTEKRKDEFRPNGTSNGNGAEEEPPKQEEVKRDDITAADLRSQILPKRRQTTNDGATTSPAPEVEKKETDPQPKPKLETAAPVAKVDIAPVQEDKTPPVKEKETTPPKEEEKVEPVKNDPSLGGLKVVGKIDLDKPKSSVQPPVSKAPKEEQPRKPEVPAPVAKKKEEKVVPPQEKVVEAKSEEKPAETKPPVAPAPVAPPKNIEKQPHEEKAPKSPSPIEKAPIAEAPKREQPPKRTPPKEHTPKPEPNLAQVKASAESSTPKQEPNIESTPQVTASAPTVEAEPEGKPQVVRAEDHTPKLSGLKVMGKIELPGDKKKKKKEEEEAKPKSEGNAAKTDEDDDKPKKRRRRRRKRKRKGGEAVATDNKAGSNNNSGNNSNSNNKSGDSGRDNRRGGRKEAPSKKEVDQSIRNTMSQLGRSPSRNRQRLRREKRDTAAARREAMEARAAESAMTLELTEFITANEFASLINVPVNEIITKSFELGMMISINQRLDAELLTLLAGDYGYSAEFVDVTEADIEIEEEEDDPENLEPRAPIITVMGHVDHGKTTLLDHLRKANVAAGEAGGITQHIGAYTVSLESGQKVTFLDTPGHEAFTAMRARGAKVTDVAIIVVAADDAVMPQTKEAISHAQAAELPMVFALNKIDKAGANPDRIRTQLSEMNILVEEWGGKFQSQEVSALKGQNVEDLLEKVIFESDLLELRANPNRLASGTVIESRLDKGRGTVVTMLVEKGTLRIGDPMVVGIHYGKVRAMIDQNGERVKEAGPATPVQILGVNGQPTAGDKFYVFDEDSKAKEISQRRSELYRQQQLRNTNRLTLEEIGRRRALGNFKELNVIIRGDVDGSVEALAGSLLKLSTEEVQVNIIQKAVGAITEADVNLAIASEAIVIAFNVRPIAKARQLADRENVDIQFYSVIYDAINDVRDALEGLLSPEIRQEIAGTAEIKEVFKISKVGNIAGCLVTSGKIERNNPVRLIRDGVVVYEGKLASLKRFKDDAKEVISGQECGMMIENYNDIHVGDEIESFRVNEVRRKLKQN